MKRIRKTLIAILAIAIVMTTAIVPALAEANANDNPMTATGRGFGGHGQRGGQQMPGNMSGQYRQMPGNRQMPDGQQPNGNGQDMRGWGGKGGRGHGMMNLDQLVKDGKLSQETLDAIGKYMSEKRQTEKEDRMKQLLDELLTAGVITQSDYDAIEAAKPDASAEGQVPANDPGAPADGQIPDAGEAPETPEDVPEIPETPADDGTAEQN